MAFFVVILGVFSSLVARHTRRRGWPLRQTRRVCVWYLASTEWILLSAPLMHVDIQETLRRGDVAYGLGRPGVARGRDVRSGTRIRRPRDRHCWRLTAFLCAFAFTGWVPPWRAPSRPLFLFGSIAIALLTALHLAIGLVAFWIGEVTPVFWVWQKLLFVFGGLMLPIRLYPPVMQRLAALTPFPDILAGPASFVLDGEAVAARVLVVRLAMWCVATTALVQWMCRARGAR